MMLFLATQALFVGNRACAPCHAEIFQAYSSTPMARSSGVVAGDVPAGAFKHDNSGTAYRIEEDGHVQVSRGSRHEERRLDYFIGSGAAGRSYVYSQRGFLFQAPVTWYSQVARWDISPGYEADRVSRWNRAIEPECLGCHASQIRSAEGFQNRYADPPFAQAGIGCERCHGPGSEHIQGRGKLVNPAKLDAVRRDSVCAQCHMSGEARVARPEKQFKDFRPGELLSSYVAYFVFDGPSALKATSYVEKLAASQCKIGSGDGLWCGTCHDPHRVPAPAQRAAWFNAKCTACHQQSACRRGPDCISCHMKKGRAVDGGHGVLTDHSIPRIANPPPGKAETSWKLRGFSKLDTGERELGLAYAEVAMRTADRRQAAEAMRLLANLPHDFETDLRLAVLYEKQGNVARAIPLYEDALRRTPNSGAGLVNLGRCYALTGRMDEAILLWRRALKANPCAAEAGQNLKIAFKSKGNPTAVEEVSHTQRFCVVE